MLTETETRLLGVMMMVILLGMGASLTFKDFAIALRRPQGIFVGLLCQYGIMPALAFGLATALALPPAYAVGLILMTMGSTLVAIVMVPLTLAFYSQGIEGEWQIPPGNVISVLFVLLVPTVIGIALRKWNANVGAVIEMIGGLLGVVVIVFLIGSWVPRNHALLLSTGFPVYAGSIGLGLCGFALGYGLSRLLKQTPRRVRTIALETGIQNGPLAVLIVTLSFTGTQQQDVLLIPVLYSLFIVLTSTAVTLWFRRLTTREELQRDQAKIGALATR